MTTFLSFRRCRPRYRDGMTEQHSTEDWRPIIAALANPNSRRTLAEVALGMDVPGSARRDRDLASLERAGLLARVDGTWTVAQENLTALLATAAKPRVEGLDRFVENGRIMRWPAAASARDEVLRWALDRTIESEVLGERELTERLAGLTDDPALLRRALVDAGLLARSPDGSDYRRP